MIPENKLDIIKFQQNDHQKEVVVSIDGQLFTKYIYGDSLYKPVLYPLVASNQKIVTRGFPLEPRSNERVCHPHHIGHWMNFGDVNGIDFWNNSDIIPVERKKEYGRLVHRRIIDVSANSLAVHVDWLTHLGDCLIEETTTFSFIVDDSVRIIDRTTIWKSVSNQPVVLGDNKEGLCAIRLARAFEAPEVNPIFLTDSAGKVLPNKMINNEHVTGFYRNSDGLERGNVWGKRARWVVNETQIDGENVSVAMIDHPGNIGYPTVWHAREYGLFAANNLGSNSFSKEAPVVETKIMPNDSLEFRYRIIIKSGLISNAEMEHWSERFQR